MGRGTGAVVDSIIHHTPVEPMKGWWRWLAVPAVTASLSLAVWAVPIPSEESSGWLAYQRGDYAAAYAWFEAGAKKGDRLAQFNLAMLLLRGEGAPVDIDGGVAWLTKAANAGMSQAQYNLGLLA